MRKLNFSSNSCLFLLLFIAMLSTNAFAQIRLPRLITDHMVLQQQTSVKLWGWAKPGEKITMTTSWDKNSVITKADKDGK